LIKNYSFLFLSFLQITLLLPAHAKFSFREKFIEISQKDGDIDKLDLKYLKSIANDDTLSDTEFAKDTIKNLSKYKKRIKLEYNLFNPNNHQHQIIYFTLTPTYSEFEKIAGKNIKEIISNISQRDNLKETVGDGDRCASASMINSYLLLGGNFSFLAKKFNVGSELTYRNVHLLQEKLYNYGNLDKSPGIYSGYKYSSYSDGNIFNIRPSGEITILAQGAGIKVTPIIGDTKQNINSRKNQVLKFFKNNPISTIQSGVYLDIQTGDILKPRNESEQNHVITIFKYNNDIYFSDSGNVDNGDFNNARKMSNYELNELVYNTPGIVMGLTRG